MRWQILGIMFLLSIALVSADNQTTNNQSINAPTTISAAQIGQCDPADPVNNDYAGWVVLAVVIGAAILLISQIKSSTVLSVIGMLFIIAAMVYAWHSLELNKYTIHYGLPGSTHEHADFSVMVNNQIVDFTNDRYMSYIGHELSIYVHLHTQDNVVHKHATGVTWQYFFNTIGVHMDDNCIDVHGSFICGATFLVNGTQINTLNTEIHEGDRALFHYGQGNATKFFDKAVGNNSCLHSGTCPERGFVPGCN